MNAVFIAAVLAASTPQDFLDGAEIGDANHYVALESHGKYHAEKTDKKAGNTVLKGTWHIQNESQLEVKIASCKGPACKGHDKGFKAEVAVVADRAMTVKSTPHDAMLETGSYYCRYQGCEKRTGVELLSKNVKALAINYLLDFMIDKNRPRNVTVVWWGKKLADDVKQSRIEYCSRDAERGKQGAELVQGDLAELPWLKGKLEITQNPDKDCLWDVRVYIADDVVAPPARPRAK